MKIALLYPNQLFDKVEFGDVDVVILHEDTVYFGDKTRNLKFNMLKLIFQRASMRYYADWLQNRGYRLDYQDWQPDAKAIYRYIHKTYGACHLVTIDPVDVLVEKRLRQACRQYHFQLTTIDNPAFLLTNHDIAEYVASRRGGGDKFYQYHFYIWHRKHAEILMHHDKPLGGKWSFDKYNRANIPGRNFADFADKHEVADVKLYHNDYYTEAKTYCEHRFQNWYPDVYRPESINLYPVTHSDAKRHFRHFLQTRFEFYADYQDAIDFRENFMFHSVISPQLNNGLLRPKWVLDEILKWYAANKSQSKNLRNVEAYVRQLNWREYSRLLYREIRTEMMTANYYDNDRYFTPSWYLGTTGIIPVDLAIKQAFQYGYLHHIVRLMIMANFMNLVGIHPDDAYRWFMEFSLDSYDWVMINNVYSMGFQADGGLTTTKPYVSSSAYVTKMSNIARDGDWDTIWDSLYYAYLHRQRRKLHHRALIYLSHLRRLPRKRLDQCLRRANRFIADYTNH